MVILFIPRVIEMMLLPSPSNFLVRLLFIEGQVGLTVKQDSSVIQVRLTSRKNFCAIASLNEVSSIPKSIKEDSGRTVP